MARAEALCEARGVKLTELRRQVLDLVWSGHRPLGAYEILTELARLRGGKAQPPTVYRALEFLREQGLVHRVESLNAYVGCTAPDEQHQSQLLLCRCCGDAAELQDTGGLAVLEERAVASGFRVERVTVELSGVCPACAETQAGKQA
ncbi:MAG: zinc uptake transcriptional repressor Zur [Rhodospirillales bacterium]